MTDANLSDLDPRLAALVPQFLARCGSAGLTCRITITWRDPNAQNAAYAAGLSKAQGGQSPHNCVDADGNPASKAFDFALDDENGDYIKNGDDSRYAIAGDIAIQLGLGWGGSWNLAQDGCNPDYDHVQLANWKTIGFPPTEAIS